MELIIKPTARCNFSCRFCSASSLEIQHLDGVSKELKDLLYKVSPELIIITGGDPLCVSPYFYKDILSLGNWKLSLTTNLKSFYLDPDRWIDILRTPRVSVCTSFQYGDGRMWDNSTQYSEEMFRKVSAAFKSAIGYQPPFIAVISKDNEDRALDHLLLAKDLRTKCKLNQMMPLGKSKEFYPQWKIVRIWLKAYEEGLQEWLDDEVSLHHGGCGTNISGLCSSTIRAVMASKDGSLKVTACEDDLLDENAETIEDSRLCENPHREAIQLDSCVSPACASCELFYLCNGCKQNRKLNKLVPEHCEKMLEVKDKIMQSGWSLQ